VATSSASKDILFAVNVVDTPLNKKISSQPSPLTNSTTATFAFTSSQTQSTFECRLDNEQFAPCPSPKTYDGLPAGQHTFEVRAIDQATNTDPTPAQYTWTIVATYPLTINKAGDGDGTINSDQSITWGPSYPKTNQVVTGTTIRLFPAPSSTSLFKWSTGTCTGYGECKLTITGPVDLTATFTFMPPVRLFYTTPAYYSLIQEAYGAASGGVTIQAKECLLDSNFTLDKAIPIQLKRVYNADYSDQTGTTTIKGKLTVGKGSLVVDRLIIR
jgi:hypothetical protein